MRWSSWKTRTGITKAAVNRSFYLHVLCGIDTQWQSERSLQTHFPDFQKVDPLLDQTVTCQKRPFGCQSKTGFQNVCAVVFKALRAL